MDATVARRLRFLRATQGLSTKVLADMFQLSPETVRRCLRWDTWRNVGEEGPGATAAEWQAPAAPAAVHASMARLQGLLAAEGQPAPSLEEALKAAPEEPAPALDKLRSELAVHARLGRELDELAGHGNGAVVGSTNTATAPETDGGTK